LPARLGAAVIPVLVTGGAGYIGSHTCKALARRGFVPIAVDNLSLGRREVVRWGPLEVADLLDGPTIREVLQRHRIAAVVHFAASAYVGDSVRDPAAYYRNNLLTTLQLLDAMRACEIKTLVFSSSCSVYGDPVTDPISEDHPTRPVSPYGQTKLDCENAIRWYGAAYAMRWVSLRYFNAAGADPSGETGEDHDPETRLIPRAILAAMGRAAPLQVFGDDYSTPDGTAIRDYVHVADLAEAHVLALEYMRERGAQEILNLGTGRGYSVSQVLQTIEAVSTRLVPHTIVARRKGDPASVVADARAARDRLLWQPGHSDLKTIVQSAWRWQEQLGSRRR
jgi:UDP-arabinose 4-epimerase